MQISDPWLSLETLKNIYKTWTQFNPFRLRRAGGEGGETVTATVCVLFVFFFFFFSPGSHIIFILFLFTNIEFHTASVVLNKFTRIVYIYIYRIHHRRRRTRWKYFTFLMRWRRNRISRTRPTNKGTKHYNINKYVYIYIINTYINSYVNGIFFFNVGRASKLVEIAKFYRRTFVPESLFTQ